MSKPGRGTDTLAIQRLAGQYLLPMQANFPDRLRSQLVPAALALALTLAMALLFLSYAHQRSGAWLAAPLDDTYIHFQYAKQLARGEVLRFNDGDSPSTGATSPLYLLLLAPGWLIGFRGLSLHIWTWLANGALHVAGALALFGLLRGLSSSRALAYTGLVAFCLNGPFLWGTFSGMEIALFSTLGLLTLRAAWLHAEQGTDRRSLLLWGCLLALARPEGMLMAGALTLWLCWRQLAADGTDEAPLWRRLWRCRTLAAPLLTGVALLLVYLALTGRISTNAAIKSHLRFLSDAPARYWESSLRWLPMTLQILLEKWPGVVRTLTTPLALVGLAGWLSVDWRPRRPGPGVLVALWLVLLTLFYAFTTARRDHFDRYYLPYFGLILLCCWWSLGWAYHKLQRRALGPALLAGLILLFMLPDTLFWAQRFGDNCRDLVQQHFRVAAWIRQNLPRQARIAVNDAGALPYLSERYTYDIVGLAHNAFYQRKTEMMHSAAAIFEALETLPHRPDYMVAYPEWIPGMPQLKLLEQLKAFPLRERTIVANETKIVWKLRWDLLAQAQALPAALAAGLQVVDRLDVADLESEQEHDYRRLDRGEASGVLLQRAAEELTLIDGGRRLSRGETFRLRAQPGRPARLVIRTSGPGALQLEVQAGDQQLGSWKGSVGPGLQLLSFDLPARAVRRELPLRLTAKSPYTSFHYWLLQ